MAEVGARVELEERLAELGRQRRDGELTEIGYNLQRNLLITRSDELARRRRAATQATLTGGSVTLLGYADHFGSGSSINNPLPSGAFYAAVQPRICAGPVESIVSPFQFVLSEPDKTQVGVASGPTVGRQPELSLQQLPAESCTSGLAQLRGHQPPHRPR
jgi:hypothetical protein